ncbi:hypothetical protein K0U00_26900, partial [Paenibacillus sepulcri]|nr:hypothetical protein [Paenibacillus sepulcri]
MDKSGLCEEVVAYLERYWGGAAQIMAVNKRFTMAKWGIAVLILLLTLAGCGAKENNTEQADNAAGTNS